MSNIWAYLAKLTLISKLQTTSAVHLEQLHCEPYVGCWCDAFVKRCVILSVGKSATPPSGAAFSPTDRCQMGTMRLCELFFYLFFFFCFGLPPSLGPSLTSDWLAVCLLQTPRLVRPSLASSPQATQNAESAEWEPACDPVAQKEAAVMNEA